jgi:hypothetical protein
MVSPGKFHERALSLAGRKMDLFEKFFGSYPA